MSNKKQLQQHNADLATALGDIDGLPMAEDVKHGKCVWERTTYTGTIWENPTIRFSFENSYHDMRITSDDIDLSMIDGSFFVGMILNFTEISTGGTYTLEFTSYDNESGIITIGGNFASGRTAVFENGVIKANSTICSSSCSYSNSYKFSGKKYSADYSETDNRYVVSDIINKYPDDGERDGNWYKKMKGEILDKLDFGSFKVATATANVSIKHSLGVIPTDVYVIPKDRVRSTSSGIYSAVLSKNWLCMDNGWGKAYYGFYAGYTVGAKGVESSGITVNTDTITVSASANFSPECEYYWFAIV